MGENVGKKKVDNHYRFVQKNKICAKTHVKILVMFYHIILIFD